MEELSLLHVDERCEMDLQKAATSMRLFSSSASLAHGRIHQVRLQLLALLVVGALELLDLAL
jgi:hypothetical protein